MHLAILGASGGVAYNVLLSALSDTRVDRVSLLLRKPGVFESNEHVAPAIASGRVRVLQGDATREAELEALLGADEVDVIVTSIGGAPRLTLRGIVIDQPGVCTRSALALLRVLARLHATPRVVAVSSMGIGDNHALMPLPLRILYPWLLHTPHQDKEGLEYLLQRAASALPTPRDVPSVLSASDAATAPEAFLPEVVVVRPALLTDGAGEHEVKAAEDAYTYYVSRADVGRFIARRCLIGDEWVNKMPVVGY
ncbi:hypothetical protein VHUM_00357 [Vanrija humicola]|uniref:NAD(P)-binding domain-containing protein n=1 Tax=Vanrija humicola TaxID=5417 RepID=A0A7D8V2C1_VANHU|nr:hypothetical protein VHUM_00357 [Vanrija humicola]